MHQHYPMLVPEARVLLIHEARKLIRLAERPPQCPGNAGYARALRDALRKLDGPFGDVVLTSDELHAVRIAVVTAKGYGPIIPRSLDRFMEALMADHPVESSRLPVRKAV